MATSIILKENSTHKAVKENGKIRIYLKGLSIEKGYVYPNGDVEEDDFFLAGEYLYSLPLEDEDDLLSIFDRYDEDNRINVAELQNSL